MKCSFWESRKRITRYNDVNKKKLQGKKYGGYGGLTKISPKLLPAKLNFIHDPQKLILAKFHFFLDPPIFVCFCPLFFLNKSFEKGFLGHPPKFLPLKFSLKFKVAIPSFFCFAFLWGFKFFCLFRWFAKNLSWGSYI